jgi:hypothetical protein
MTKFKVKGELFDCKTSQLYTDGKIVEFVGKEPGANLEPYKGRKKVGQTDNADEDDLEEQPSDGT